MDTIYYRYFYALASGLSVGDASEEFSISESALSKSIVKLENELGCVLFDRKYRPMKLTSTGERLKFELDDLIPRYENMINAVSKVRSSIRYATLPANDIFNIYSFFESYSESHNDISLIQKSSRDFDYKDVDILSSLKEEKLDFVIMHDSVFIPPTINKVYLTNDPVDVIFPANHPLALNSEISVQQLEGIKIYGSGSTLSICDNLNHLCNTRLALTFTRDDRQRILQHIRDNGIFSLYYRSDINLYNLDFYGLCSRPLSELRDLSLVILSLPNSKYHKQIDDITAKLSNFVNQFQNTPPFLNFNVIYNNIKIKMLPFPATTFFVVLKWEHNFSPSAYLSAF
jgi:DNA-binding transcriptional LysR family regulator